MMFLRSEPGKRWLAVLAVGVALVSARPASATLLYATSITQNEIFTVDTVTHTLTPYLNVGQNLDSLFFDPSGRIVYSELNNGRVQAFNPGTNSTVTLASGLTAPIDLALEPNLTSFLVSDSTSHLVRISLNGSGVQGSLNVGNRPDGVIYDTSGRLFANISTGFQNNDSQVKQINPTTGATIATSGNTGVFLDGLTYDSFSGFLYAADYNNGRLVKINPNTLAFTFLTPLGAALSQPDGVTSDGMGKLYLASRGNAHVIEYDIATNTATNIATINGLDDLAPASGFGAAVPEPSALLLAGVGGLALLARRLRRSRHAASA
jgi:DNA-binding beta-propeller fold protein YncE